MNWWQQIWLAVSVPFVLIGAWKIFVDGNLAGLMAALLFPVAIYAIGYAVAWLVRRSMK